MKKLFAMLLAVAMILSLATVAFAEETVDTTGWTSAATTLELGIQKIYVVNGETDETLYPAETLNFTVDADASNPDSTNLSVKALDVEGNSNQILVINVPSYTTVGTYKYTIAETAGNTQGVTYTTETIDVTILVTYDYENECLVIEPVLSTAGDNKDGKDDTFTNTYDVGSLTVSKIVTGNLGDKSKKFDVTVTFTAENPVLSTITYTGGAIAATDWVDGKAEVVISLAHGESVTFDNIPAGVTYTVVENDYTGGELNGENAYDAADYDFSDTEKKISAEDKDTVDITNNKETEVETGIVLDSMPYIVILAIAAFGMFVMLTKKRYEV